MLSKNGCKILFSKWMKNEMATTMKTTLEMGKPKGGVTMIHMMIHIQSVLRSHEQTLQLCNPHTHTHNYKASPQISASFADRPSERERWRGGRDFEAFFILFLLTVPLEGNTRAKLHTHDFISTSPFLKNDMTSPQRRSSKQVPDGSLTIAKTEENKECINVRAVAAFRIQSRISGLNPVVSPQSREIWSLVNEGMVKVPWKQFLGCLCISLAMATRSQSQLDGSCRETHWPSCHT